MKSRTTNIISLCFFVFFIAVTYFNVDSMKTFIAIIGALGAEKSLDYSFIRKKE